MEKNVFILPGWQDSDAGHWQSLWQARYGWKRVVQKDWMAPKRADWTAEIVKAISAAPAPPVLVCHSLGGPALAHAVAARPDLKIRAAFVVAPPDFDHPGAPPEISDFRPTPLVRFAFPSLLIASSNDPYCSLAHAEHLAKHWGSAFQCVGDRHHIGSAAHLGDWEEGRKLLAAFLDAET